MLTRIILNTLIFVVFFGGIRLAKQEWAENKVKSIIIIVVDLLVLCFLAIVKGSITR